MAGKRKKSSRTESNKFLYDTAKKLCSNKSTLEFEEYIEQEKMIAKRKVLESLVEQKDHSDFEEYLNDQALKQIITKQSKNQN